MTENAVEAIVPLFPALAVLQPIGSESRVKHTRCIYLARDNVLPGSVARATKVDGIHALKPRGIQNQSRVAFLRVGPGRGHMFRARTVTRFAGNSGKGVVGCELAASR